MESNQIIPPCKEMCYDYLNVCGNVSDNQFGIWKHWKHINCNYLPSMDKNVSCFYEPIGCRRPPPAVKHARVVIDFTNRDNYSLPVTVEYSCNEGFEMEGNKTVHCKI